MMAQAGTLSFPAQLEAARVIALTADGRACAEATSDSAGRWRLECSGQPGRALARMFVDGIVVAEATAQDGMTPGMPEGNACCLKCEGADAHAQFALDPVRSDGGAANRIQIMRTKADGSVRLHIAEFDCASTPRTLSLQAGRYRVSGGSIAFQLGAPPGTQLSAVAVGGEAVEPGRLDFFEFDIDGTTGLLPRFTERAAQ